MAGHSKFKNIQHRKGAQDKKRAKIFSKLGKEITVATKLGAPDPDMNPRLRTAIAAAKASNMPNDRIAKAIKSGSPGGDDDKDYDEVRYEGYGPGGVAVIVEALTENRNRTASDVRTAFSKHGGSLGTENSVSFMFDRIGFITYEKSAGSDEDIFEIGLEAGAENVESNNDLHEITTNIEDFVSVCDELEKKLGTAKSAERIWSPQNTTSLNEKQTATMLKLIDALEDSDDVQTVFSNFDADEAIIERLMASA